MTQARADIPTRRSKLPPVRKLSAQDRPHAAEEKRQEVSRARVAAALDLRDAGLKYREIAALLGVSTERARNAVEKAAYLRDHPHWRQALSTRLCNGLKSADCFEDGDDEATVARRAAAFGAQRWSLMRYVGKGTRAELVAWLVRHGLTLAP